MIIPPCDYNKFSLIPALQQWRKLAQGLWCVKHPSWHLLAAIKSRVKTKVLKNDNDCSLSTMLLASCPDAGKDESCFSREAAISDSQLEGIDSLIQIQGRLESETK